VNGDELAYAGAAEQARLVRAREVSAHEVVTATLARIARHDPRLNAYRVVLAEQALREAEDPPDGPLCGVPVAIKDDTDVAGEYTCWGTAAGRSRSAPPPCTRARR
jgi:amidase